MDTTAWAMIETERRGLAELLGALTPEQWETRSLCTEWRVRDVAAHLAMTPAREPTPRALLAALVRTRGRLWAAGRDVAVAYARRPYDQLVTELRRGAGSRARPLFVQEPNILLDLLVHGQDIAVPLAIDRPVPPAAGVAGLQRIWAMGWPFHARRRLAGVHLRAVDCDWSAGSGPAVEGTAGDLLLLATARPAALGRLRGPGVQQLRERLRTPTAAGNG